MNPDGKDQPQKPGQPAPGKQPSDKTKPDHKDKEPLLPGNKQSGSVEPTKKHTFLKWKAGDGSTDGLFTLLLVVATAAVAYFGVHMLLKNWNNTQQSKEGEHPSLVAIQHQPWRIAIGMAVACLINHALIVLLACCPVILFIITVIITTTICLPIGLVLKIVLGQVDTFILKVILWLLLQLGVPPGPIDFLKQNLALAGLVATVLVLIGICPPVTLVLKWKTLGTMSRLVTTSRKTLGRRFDLLLITLLVSALCIGSIGVTRYATWKLDTLDPAPKPIILPANSTTTSNTSSNITVSAKPSAPATVAKRILRSHPAIIHMAADPPAVAPSLNSGNSTGGNQSSNATATTTIYPPKSTNRKFIELFIGLAWAAAIWLFFSLQSFGDWVNADTAVVEYEVDNWKYSNDPQKQGLVMHAGTIDILPPDLDKRSSIFASLGHSTKHLGSMAFAGLVQLPFFLFKLALYPFWALFTQADIKNPTFRKIASFACWNNWYEKGVMIYSTEALSLQTVHHDSYLKSSLDMGKIELHWGQATPISEGLIATLCGAMTIFAYGISRGLTVWIVWGSPKGNTTPPGWYESIESFSLVAFIVAFTQMRQLYSLCLASLAAYYLQLEAGSVVEHSEMKDARRDAILPPGQPSDPKQQAPYVELK